MSQESKYLKKQFGNGLNFMRNQPMGYLLTVLLIGLILIGILSVFGMVKFDIYFCNVLINSFFWLDFIYHNFGYFILLYGIMLAVAIILKRKNTNNVYIGTLETDETHLWQVRIIFVAIISVFIVLICFQLSGFFKIHIGFYSMIITPDTLAEEVIKQMYNIIWMAFCAFGIAIIVV